MARMVLGDAQWAALMLVIQRIPGVVQNLPFSGYTGARKPSALTGRIFGSKVVQCRRRSASPAHACLG
jgi:hypothetical protein